jgi:glutamyl-tRNA(Gln) amidotransferase subunit D
MLEAGAIEGADMLPEVALVKLMWVLANSPQETWVLMKRPLAGEISPSSPLTTKGQAL